MIEGRGIPDPWLTRSRSDSLEFPFIRRTHSENGNIKKNIFQYLRGEGYSGNKPCFCCEKKFLFDCPDKAESIIRNAKDKTNLLNCPCLECHGKEKKTPVVCSQRCNCIPIFQNWILEHPDSRNCKKLKKKIPSDLSSTISSKYNADEESSTESLYPSNLLRHCSCLQNKRKNVYFDYCNVGMQNRGRSRNQKGIFTDHNGQCNRYVISRNVKSFLCPCLLNFKHAQRDSQNKPEDTNLKSSKEVQTDGQPLRESKIIQTDKTKVFKCKTDKNKCSCPAKWVGSNVIRCESSNPIFNPQTGRSFTMCFSHPSLICPYPHTNQFLIHHVDPKRKYKKEKRRYYEVDKGLQCNLLPTYVREEGDSPLRGYKPKEVLEIKNYLTRPEIDLSSCRPVIESFDYSKYLAEKRVKKFLQEKEFPLERKLDFQCRSYGTATTLKRFEDERTTFRGRKRNDKETDMFKPISRPKNHDFESSPRETNYDSLHKDKPHELNSSLQNSTRKSVQIENFKQDSPVKVNFHKQLESNKSRGYSLVGHCKSSCSQIKKRKKVNRKGKRKPLRVIYSSFERPSISQKFPNSQLSNKVGQLDQTDNKRGEISLETVSFGAVENSQKALRAGKVKNLQFLSVEEGSSKKIFHTFTDTRASIEQETINTHYEWIGQRYLMENFEKPLKSEFNFNNVLQQISSHNSGTTWSSDTLKNIVDELLLERKTLERQNV